MTFPPSTFPAPDLAFVPLWVVCSDRAMNSCEMLLCFPAQLQIPVVYKPGFKTSLRTRKTAPSSLSGAFWDSQRKSIYSLHNPALLSDGVIGKVRQGMRQQQQCFGVPQGSAWAGCSGWVLPSSHSFPVWREARCWEKAILSLCRLTGKFSLLW